MAQQTFEELVAAVKQAESRGKRYAADGKTLTTSPKGALGEMQVMPKTITDPGFGVAPAKDKSPDEIARVGVDYLQAMKQKYGDTEKALIAYNMGPGATDKWLASGAKPEKLPEETRTYVERVKGFLGKDVPRETMAKKDREPLPPSLPPMAKADQAQPTPAKATTMAKLDVKSMPASYQAAFALAALADAQDEEDDKAYNENKSTETEEFFANYKPVNKLASLDLSVTPVMMADGGEVTEAKETARKGEAYQELEKYLESRGEMPSVKIGGYMPGGTNGIFTSDNLNIGSGTIKINKDTAKALVPSVLAHEVTHAADRQLRQQAIEQGMFGNSNQFTEAYEKMVGPEGRNRTQLLRKRYPEFEQDNRYYRSEPKEVAAHGIGAYAGPNIQDRAPRHVDATAATEFRILMDLAQRNVDKGPKGLEKIPAFFRKFGRYADGGEVEQERLTPQQIERIAERDAAEREAASNAAFIAQKSGIGRKEGNISKALKSGEGQVEFLKGMTNVPQNILGAPVDFATMAMRPFGYDVEKPFMGSEYLKEQSRAAGLGFTPSTDPTLAGFYGAGDLASNLVNPAGATRTGVKAAGAVAEKAGEAARDFQQYNQQLAVPGASYIRRPAGGVFPTAKNVEDESISALDKSLKDIVTGNLKTVRAPAENKAAAKEFIDTKLRDYFKTKAGSVSDPLREALIGGRIKIPKDTPLEEQFPQALVTASRAGDVTAMKEIEKRFDNMMGINSYRVQPAGAGGNDQREAAESFKQIIMQQMKANPSVIPDEFLLRLTKKDTSKLSKQEQATEVASIRQKLADNPTLFNTIYEPKISRLLDKDILETVTEESVSKYPNLYPSLANAPKRQEGIMALQADVPITDLNYMGFPDIFNIGRSDLVEELTKISPKDLAQMSVPEFYAKAIPSIAKKEVFKEKVRTVDKLASAKKPVPPEIGQFGTKEFLPTDSSGMTWREITDPQAALIQAKFLGNSIGGYAEAGTYGPLDKGINALKDGETRLFSLYDKNGHAVNNVEFITPKIADDKLHGYKANTITQMNGNGVKTGNVVPEQYAEQMLDLVNALNPKDIPLSIKQLFQDKGLIVAPPPKPLNAARTIQMNMFQPPAQRADGGMIERQPNDNRRYL